MVQKLTGKFDKMDTRGNIESRDAISDENHFSSIPRPKDIIPNSIESQRDDHSDDVPSETPEPRRAIDDEIGSIMENNTWVLFDLPPGCKPLGCKWIFKRKMKVDGTIEKFKARLCVYRKFDSSGKGVIIFLYVDDMLIFETDQNQVDKTKKFFSSKFSMKDLGEAHVILGIKIKRENKRIVITKSHYIEKILKKFNHEDCSPVSTPMDPVEKLRPNTSKPVDQLKYSRAIGGLMYAMTSTRPDIAYEVGRLSRFTSNHSRQHWQAITRVFKYINEFEFVALAAAGKEAKWLRNLIHEILIWSKPIAPISIQCDSAPKMAIADSQVYNGKSRHLGVRHEVKNASKPIETQKPLLKDEDGEEVNVHMYWLMIGSLMYLTSSRPNIMFASTVMTKTINGEAQLHARVDGKKIIITEASIRRDLQLADEESVDCLPNSTMFEQLALMGTVASAIICLATNEKFNFSKWIFDSMIRKLDNVSGKFLMYPRVGKGFSERVTPLFPIMVVQSELGEDEVVHKELGDSLVRVSTTASSLEAEHDSGNINKAQSKATPNESSSQESNSGGGPRCQETIRDTTAQTMFESVFKHSNDLLLARGNTLRTDKDRMKLNELIELCTNLQTRVLDLEKTKTTQSNEIASLKRRVKKLKKNNRSRTHKLKRLYKGRIEAIDADEDITLVNDRDDVDKNMFDMNDLEEITLAQALEALKTLKPKVKGIVIHEKEAPDEFDEEERLARERAEKEQEANVALIETWDGIQAKLKMIINWLKDCKRKKMFDRAFKRVNTFEDVKIELVKGKEKRVGEELIQESTNKQKVDDDKEKAELKQLMETIPDEEEIAIDAISLADVKSSRIIDWKIHKGGKKSYYQIVRANGNSDVHVL
nr:hypothetical protein [Tanacetum cinerariifolium]